MKLLIFVIVLSGYFQVNQVFYNLVHQLKYLVIYMGSLGISCAFLMSMVHHQLLVTLRKFLISHYGFIYNRYYFGACLLVCIMWTIFNWRKLLIQLFFRVFKHGY
jgi:hypothetical protein